MAQTYELCFQLLSRLGKIRRFESRIFKLLAGIDKTLLNLLSLQITRQFVFETGKAWNLGRFNVQQLDQVITKAGAHRLRYLIFVERIQCCFKDRIVDTRPGEAQITTTGGRTRVLRELFG